MTRVPSPLAGLAGAKTPVDSDISLWIPDGMHSLGLDLSPEDRAEHIRDTAGQVWAAGTDFQRETTAEIYSEIADAAAEDGALYAGVCFLSLDGGLPASASLVVRAEETDGTDADIVATGIAEGLSTLPGKEAYRTTAAGRPIAVAFSMANSVMDTDDEPKGTAESAGAALPGDPAVLTVATAEAYVPLPEISQLLVLCISTPSLEIFPDLVALLSGITETLEIDGPAAASADPEGAPRPSRISEL